MKAATQEVSQQRHVIYTDNLGYTYCPDCALEDAERQVVSDSSWYDYHCELCETELPVSIVVSGRAVIEYPFVKIF